MAKMLLHTLQGHIQGPYTVMPLSQYWTKPGLASKMVMSGITYRPMKTTNEKQSKRPRNYKSHYKRLHCTTCSPIYKLLDQPLIPWAVTYPSTMVPEYCCAYQGHFNMSKPPYDKMSTDLTLSAKSISEVED